MKTTIEIPDDLLIEAKKRAAEERITLRRLFARGLRRELDATSPRHRSRERTIHWVVVHGGLPLGLDLADRERMHDSLRERAGSSISRSP